MKRKITFFFTAFLCCFYACVNAQVKSSYTVTGKVSESSTGAPLAFAIVKLVEKQDSTKVTTALTNKLGVFKIENQPSGNYEVKISFVGYETVTNVISLNTTSKTIDLGIISLKKGINLNEVVVNGIIAPVKIKRDTLEYDARAFRTAPNANTESLLKKVAGIDVDLYGNIKIQGLDLSKVTVEGKKFFGDNYKIATQNLPADAISKIQIIDSKTEQSKISGIDDGKREKVINLVLKDDKKGGYFGSVSIAGGTSDRYLTSGSINHFKENLQLNLLLMSNNNNQSYSVGEASSFSGNNFGAGAISGEANGVAFGRISQGLTKTNSSALNFAKQWGAKGKHSIHSNYIGSLIDTKTDQQSAIQNILTDNVFLTNKTIGRNNNSQNHGISVDYRSTIDSLTSLYVSTNGSLDKQDAISAITSLTMDAKNQPVNNASQDIVNQSNRPAFNGYLSFNRKLKQRKGAYAISINQDFSESNADNYNVNTTFYYLNSPINSSVLINQLLNNDNRNATFTFRGQLSRVLSKDQKTSLLTNAGFVNSLRRADQYTLDYNPLNDRYEVIVPALTSNYKNRLTQRDMQVGLNRSNSKTTVIASASLQSVTLHGTVQDKEITRNYFAVLPRFTFSYRSDSRKSISFTLSSSLGVPTISDLQPVQNNLNQFYIREGNPLLKPSKSYSTQLSYNTSNIKTGSYAFYRVYFNLYQHNFSTSTIFDEQTAISYVKPINVSGNYSATLDFTFRQPIKLFKGLNLDYGVNATKQNSINYINYVKNNTGGNIIGINAGLNYNYKDALMLSFSNRTSYIDTRNSVREAADNSYFRLMNTGNLNYGFTKKWRLTADLSQQTNIGRNDNFNQNVSLVNAGIQRSLMPKDQFIIEVKGYDLLNQNSNIMRTFSANRIEDVQSVNLRRYFLLRLTYKVNKIKSK
jgi:hypothetical protein